MKGPSTPFNEERRPLYCSNRCAVLLIATERGRNLVRLAGQLELSDDYYFEHLHPAYPIADLGHAAYAFALMGGEPHAVWL